jgi:hypothetical protein
MTEHIKQVLQGQFEAALSMLRARIEYCPDEQWDDLVGEGTVRQDAYHVLFWLDYYLSPAETNVEPTIYSQKGGDEFQPGICEGLSRQETLEYIEYCHTKLVRIIAAETEVTLTGNSGFPSIFRRKPLSRMELHIYNIRHVEHHAAKIGLHLRRTHESSSELSTALRWVGTGWS